MKKINVLIIDDSAVVREILSENLSRHERINVVGTAIDPYMAREIIAKTEVDVITLDIEMPKMDGLTFLRQLMKHYPIPVIILSSLADRRNQASLEAMELGAVDIVPKPGGPYSVGNILDILIDKIIAASQINFVKLKMASTLKNQRSEPSQNRILSHIETTNKLIAVGASTGGTIALEVLFKGFDKSFPPTLAVIHMPEKFTATFANRLNDVCEVTVKEAVNNEKAMPGTVYIAPGNYHLQLKSIGTDNILKVVQGPKFHGQRPAVDVLFDSVAQYSGKNSIGVLLTGMGKDGASGLLNIKKAGGFTIAQDEKSSIIFGMPKEAIDLGAADEILSLERISRRISQQIQ